MPESASRHSRYIPLLVIASFLLPVSLGAQNETKDQTVHVHVAQVAPRPQDVATMDGILAAFYDVVSGTKGQPRQWSRDATLYVPGVLFITTVVGGDGKPKQKVMSHQDLVDTFDSSLVSRGFYEQEIHRVTTQYGSVAHVLSTYVMRRTPNGPLIGRGVNSIELSFDGKRWWIACNLWDEESDANPIPKNLLP